MLKNYRNYRDSHNTQSDQKFGNKSVSLAQPAEPKRVAYLVFGTIVATFVVLILGKIYQNWDDDPNRGAFAYSSEIFDDAHDTPVYLDQSWTSADSLWFYNTTQGSNLLPYDFFLALELPESDEKFNSAKNYDRFRYLPQKPTFFNPDGLAVGFVKDYYQGTDYVGLTCAACHTAQVNYQGDAVRIDGGPAMADLVGFMGYLEKALRETLEHTDKKTRFVEAVLAQELNYDDGAEIVDDLQYWINRIELYNRINHSKLEYGFGRLDAFGRIYNRVLGHIINKRQLRRVLLQMAYPDSRRLLTAEQVDKILADVDDTIIGNDQFITIIERLMSDANGMPNLSRRDVLRVRDTLFNEPSAPVNYPFLWDIGHSDFVQWNGLAGNSTVGPLGRNAGQVIGVFATLDWQAKQPGFSIAAAVTKQKQENQQIHFKSSVNTINLRRLESHLRTLTSPEWPEDILGKIDKEKAARGELIYGKYCLSCHEIIQPKNWDRRVIGKMIDIDLVKTDATHAVNAVSYTGKSGNFQHTYQSTHVGDILVPEDAPAVVLLKASTAGVIATPDPDKTWVRRWFDWLYVLLMSFFDNDIQETIKAGHYKPDTTAKPFQSLLAYKARSLNGIWATAPYLHNGSVPSLYDLLLPAKKEGDPEDGEYRPATFYVGTREFDPNKVGFSTQVEKGFLFDTGKKGNLNAGHEYAAGRTRLPSGEKLDPLAQDQRWELVEFLKTL